VVKVKRLKTNGNYQDPVIYSLFVLKLIEVASTIERPKWEIARCFCTYVRDFRHFSCLTV